jgi:hypothetical protein
MNRIVSMGPAAILLFLGGGAALAQLSGFGAQQAPSNTPVQSVSESATALRANPQDASGRAMVVYARGQLEIIANRSSLKEILREVGLRTGMKITGTVGEEPVFGSYGPAMASTVLSNLLCGSGSNMQLKENAAGAPEELILTPRTAGPAPGAQEMPATATVEATVASSQATAASGAAVAAGATPGAASQTSSPASRAAMTSEQRQQFIQQLQQQQLAASRRPAK